VVKQNTRVVSKKSLSVKSIALIKRCLRSFKGRLGGVGSLIRIGNIIRYCTIGSKRKPKYIVAITASM